jgi:vacuolar-type H+-ATPase subunit F/Vma7
VSAIAVIGEQQHAGTFAFAGVRVVVADDSNATRAAWRSLPPDVGLVILTAAAHAALASELSQRDQRLWVVMPE